MKEKIAGAVWGAFIADAYTLGAHWVYDAKELEDLPIDWNRLNEPQAHWHEGKGVGDFTHYGDHTLWLLEYVAEAEQFDIDAYAGYWYERMKDYKGYHDASTRDTCKHLESGSPAACGPVNRELSICGRIAPLLLVCNDLDAFCATAVMFAKMTHNDFTVLEATHYFATLLWEVQKGKPLKAIIPTVAANYSETLKKWVTEGINSVSRDTSAVIREFGSSCSIEGGFPSTIHLLAKYDNFKEALVANAKAGGDSAARGMIAGMLMGAALEPDALPWKNQLHAGKRIAELLG